MEIPEQLKYSVEHEWVRIDEENKYAYVGITDYAQSELGDIVYVEVESIEETIEKDNVFGSIEAVKTVTDLFMPLSGRILELNPALHDDPEIINTDPYGEGWIIRIELTDPSQIDTLMNAESYKEYTGS